MKNYERPIVLTYDDLAEGIYAASGSDESQIDYENDLECWTMNVSKDQSIPSSGYSTFRIQANHPGTVVHISTKTTVTLVFNRPVTNVVFEGFDASVSGCTATLVRESHGNSYNSADQFNSLVCAYSDDPEELQVISSTIACTHATNVQGGFD